MKPRYYIFFVLIAFPIGFLIGLSSSEVIGKTMSFIFLIISSLFISYIAIVKKGNDFIADIVEQPRKIIAITLFIWGLSFSIILGAKCRTDLIFTKIITTDEWVEQLLPQNDTIKIKYDLANNDFYYEFGECKDNKEILRLIIVKKDYDLYTDSVKTRNFEPLKFLKSYQDEN